MITWHFNHFFIINWFQARNPYCHPAWPELQVMRSFGQVFCFLVTPIVFCHTTWTGHLHGLTIHVLILLFQASIDFSIPGKHGERPKTWQPWEARKYLDIQVMMINMIMMMIMMRMMRMTRPDEYGGSDDQYFFDNHESWWSVPRWSVTWWSVPQWRSLGLKWWTPRQGQRIWRLAVSDDHESWFTTMTSTTMTSTTMTMMITGLEVVDGQTRTTDSTISIFGGDQRAFAWRGAGDSKWWWWWR